jgi:hypothetical protein
MLFGAARTCTYQIASPELGPETEEAVAMNLLATVRQR